MSVGIGPGIIVVVIAAVVGLILLGIIIYAITKNSGK